MGLALLYSLWVAVYSACSLYAERAPGSVWVFSGLLGAPLNQATSTRRGPAVGAQRRAFQGAATGTSSGGASPTSTQTRWARPWRGRRAGGLSAERHSPQLSAWALGKVAPSYRFIKFKKAYETYAYLIMQSRLNCPETSSAAWDSLEPPVSAGRPLRPLRKPALFSLSGVRLGEVLGGGDRCSHPALGTAFVSGLSLYLCSQTIW